MNVPPKAKKKPHTRVFHGRSDEDDYFWMRDPKWPKVQDKEVLDYLVEENAYTKQFFAPHEQLIDQVYKELIGRIKLADRSVPIKKRFYYYFTVTNADSDYVIHMRHDSAGREEVILDENDEAKLYKYFNVGVLSISSNGALMAYSIDTTGDEHYTVLVKDLSTQTLMKDKLENVLGNIVWSEDNLGFYYTKVDDKWRPNELYYHVLGTEQSADVLLYRELDNTFRIGIGKTSDYQHIVIEVSSSNSTEILFIRSGDLRHTICTLVTRREDHLCSIDHFHGYFYICTNDKGKNFRLVRVDSSKDDEIPKEIVPHSDSIYLTGFSLYNEHIVIETKELGLPRIRIMTYDLHDEGSVTFPDPTYAAMAVYSCADDNGIVVHYSSLISPSTVFKYDFKTKKLTTLKILEIPSGFNSNEYQSERLYIESREPGIKIPVSIAYKKNLFKKDGSNPMFLYSYGSYGLSIPPRFSSNIISLLNRGFVYAIAHIRGGDDLGFNWYESAKFLNKIRTFNDFIDVTHALINARYTSKGNIAIMGGSAGGMLVGNVINQEPELYKSAIADVPFVDVLNTMLDESLPLTPGEYKEWGNPQDAKYYDYIKSYSPYDNVKNQNYPNLYVLAGLNDPRVTYWEPAKWVAKLRDFKTDKNVLLLETDMDTGHGGKSGRFDKLKEVAQKYAFILITME